LKTTTYRNSDANLDWTPFRTAEKQYKARFPPPDLSNVLDLATLDEARTEEIQRGVWSGRSDTVEYREITPTEPLGESKKVYIIPRIPGAMVSRVI
jgi:alkylated DNA repair protein alkB family protein 1